MSQRPPASRPASRSPPDDQKITLPPVRLRDNALRGGRQDESQQAEQSEAHSSVSQHSPQLPSPRQVRTIQPASPGGRRGPSHSRDLGVRSMLNPAEPEGASSGRWQSRDEKESPVSTIGPSSHFGASAFSTTQHTFPGQQQGAGTPPVQPGYSATFPGGRPILTPRSPRAVSLGRGRSQATIDAARSPFLSGRSRAYMVEPGQSDVPPMPTPHGQAQGQHPYGFPPSVSTPRPESNTMPAPGRTPHSQSTSPSISQHSAQTSPASYTYQQGPPASAQSYFPGSSFTQAGAGGIQFAGGPGQAGTSTATEGQGRTYSAPPPSSSQPQAGDSSEPPSASSSRQGSSSDPIQVLQFATSQGIYNVPVDVHQASKSADEKRARNAGASARFRQRRKEKERDSQAMIDKMQSQSKDLERKVRELEQERDFYRGERDRFRDVVFRTPEMRHLAMQAPQSPQTLRSSSFGSMPLGGPLPPQLRLDYQQPNTPSERPTRRRRTGPASSDHTNVPHSLPPASTLPGVAAPDYPPAPPALAPLRMGNTAGPQGPQVTTGPPNIAPATTIGPPTGPFDPYGRGQYDRGWPSERGRH